jgi:serine/threonine protein kinase
MSPLQGVESIKLISQGGNGSIYKVKFNNGQRGILKIPKGVSKDNLMYEYLAGMKLNHLRFIFPQFIETKNVFYYDDSLGHPPDLELLKTLAPHDPQHGCRTAGHQALLLKEVNGPTLKSMMKDAHFLKHDLAGVLFQIYYALHKLKYSFTHFDLHRENVLLSNPLKRGDVNPPLLFRYTEFNPPIEFVCHYLPKMIDYGRAFVKGIDLSGLTTPSCNTPECKPQGRHCGFTYYHHQYQDITKPNVSQDLRLITSLPGSWAEMSRKVQFGYNVPEFKKRFTTQEMRVGQWPHRIVNVTDALKELMKKVKEQGRSEAFFEISGDKEYKYVVQQRGGTKRVRRGRRQTRRF